GTLSFAAGETSRTVSVPTADDGFVEGAETFTVVLSNASAGTVFTTRTTTVTLTDDEDGTAYGLTTANEIVTFSVSSPGTVSAARAVTGLQAGEDLVGIDMRPATGELYAVGSTSRLYVIDPATGVATQRGGVLTTALSGTAFGVDVNPTVDRIRVVSNTGQNLRINPTTGETLVDTPLAYSATDPGAGTTPRVAAAGYINSTSTNGVGAGGTTALFDVDTARDALVQQNPANTGTLSTIGVLGVAVSDTATVGIDIAGAGNAAFAVFTVDGSSAPALYRVSLTTGAATSLGALGSATVEDLTIASVAPAVTPSPSPSATPSATPTATTTPSPSCTTPQVVLGSGTIIATGSSTLRVTGAPGTAIEVLAYSQPSRTYAVVRTGTIGSGGSVDLAAVRPPTNTRLYARQVGCTADEAVTSRVLNVRTQLSLNVARTGVRAYRFSGSAIPARPNGLIVSLYRVTEDGRQVLTAQTRANANAGQPGFDSTRPAGSYAINRVFTGTGRFGFVVRTGQDLQNAPGSSNVRSLLVF
ncbi:MAG: DUF4394 domain-containing protein, partial [Frankiales bacterium]